MSGVLANGPRSRAWVCSALVLAACGSVLAAPATPDDGLTDQDRAAMTRRLLGRVSMIPQENRPAMCFVPNPTPEQMDIIMQRYQALPPTAPRDRFFTGSNVWNGNGAQVVGGQSLAASLTYSFPADGVPWGDTFATQPGNNLNAVIDGAFTAANRDRGRELIRQALASWRKYAGLTYTEVSDNGTAMDNNPARQTTRGDIRIGAISDPASAGSGVLAYNYYPPDGGDMTFISEQFAGNFGGSGTDYRFMRNVAAHEHGHGLSFAHVVPCTQTKLMEPFASTAFDQVQADDRRGGMYHYGDRLVGNLAAATARDFGNLTSPSVRSVIERNLSTNRRTGNAGTSSDWFRFTLGGTQNVVVTAAPTGGTYNQGSQSSGCNGTTSSTNTTAAGNLNIELRNNSGATVIQTAATAAAGINEVLTANNLAAGTYWVRVFDSSAATTTPNSALQMYDLTVRVGTSLAPPYAVAGVNKRIQANLTCFLMGHINSEPTESGATITGYAWDVDGNGTFDNTFAQPTVVYPSNGLYNVTLRVTDSNGQTDTDTIQVTVFGATTTITNITPGASLPGATVPVTINGSNFRGVTTASQFTAAGAGVTFTGTPVVNAMGTQVTGLSIVVAGNATPGARAVTVTNSDGQGGTGTSPTAFTVNGDAPVNDECAAALTWASGLGSKAFSNIFASDSTPQSFGGTLCTGTMSNDVWYRWTAAASSDVIVTTDTAAAGFSSRVAVYADVCPIGAPIQCGEFGQPYTFAAVSGTTYLFRVGSVIPNATGTANVILSASTTGACCAVGGACNTMAQASCSGTYMGDGTTCTPYPCPTPPAACCFASGACTFVNQTDCQTAGGTYQGEPTSCTPNNCTQPAAACCFSNGTCGLRLQTACVSQGGVWQGVGVSCVPNNCPQPSGACCATDGSCTVTTQAACAANFSGAGTSCAPNNCAQPSGACCATDGSCAVSTQAACAGSFSGVGTSCAPNNCPQPTGACCAADGTCAVSTQATCAANFSGVGTSCSPNNCPQPSGACCATDGSCTITTQTLCAGTFSGAGTSCAPNNCPQPTGACCAGATCSVSTAATCVGANQSFAGAGVACNAPGNTATPCCKANFNRVGGVSVQDIFDFLAGWFSADPLTDINGQGGVSVQDIFDFLSAWFAGC